MQKWEYLEVHFEYDSKTQEYPLSINSENHPATTEDRLNISRLFNRFGVEGWELVLLSGGSWIFKRPISD